MTLNIFQSAPKQEILQHINQNFQQLDDCALWLSLGCSQHSLRRGHALLPGGSWCFSVACYLTAGWVWMNSKSPLTYPYLCRLACLQVQQTFHFKLKFRWSGYCDTWFTQHIGLVVFGRLILNYIWHYSEFGPNVAKF